MSGLKPNRMYRSPLCWLKSRWCCCQFCSLVDNTHTPEPKKATVGMLALDSGWSSQVLASWLVDKNLPGVGGGGWKDGLGIWQKQDTGLKGSGVGMHQWRTGDNGSGCYTPCLEAMRVRFRPLESLKLKLLHLPFKLDKGHNWMSFCLAPTSSSLLYSQKQVCHFIENCIVLTCNQTG